jgi:hypothetical protein
MSTIKSSDEHLTLNADGSSKDIKFQANGVEKASISSTGVMTATSFAGSGANLTGVGVDGISSSADATAITIDSSENVGIGVTPASDWKSIVTGLQIGNSGSIFARNDSGETKTFINENVKWTADAQEYINNGYAAQHQMDTGSHTFKVAPSGSADSAISWTTAMTIDNSGYVTMPAQPSFRVGGTNGETGSGTVVKHTTTYHNTGSHYSSSTGRFTAPVAGSYFFGVKIISAYQTTSNEQNIKIVKNGSTALDARFRGYTESSAHPTIVLDLAASDYVNISVASNDTDIYAGAAHNQFYGYLIG